MAQNNTTFTAQPDAHPDFHPVLRPMCATASRWIDEGHPAGFPMLSALAICNGRRPFWRGSAHFHYDYGSDGGTVHE
jgi:hypothetical protein